MRSIIPLAAAGLLAAATLPALASSDDIYCRTSAGQMTVQAITAKLAGMGYDVRKVELDDGCYEVYAVDKSGVRREIKLDPATGRILRSERRS